MQTIRRVVAAGCPHHIILRGNNRRRLFSYPTEYRRFLWDMCRAQRKAPVAVHAIMLMKNHVHLVVTPPDGATLARFVHGFAQRYAQLRNARRGASGKLFEQRFIAIPITSEQQLAETTAYVELNPVRAGVVGSPGDWAWSTYGLHDPRAARCTIPEALWSPSAWYLGLDDDPIERAKRYAAWVCDCRARGEAPALAEKVRRIESLSSARYARRVERPNRSRAT